MGSAISVNKCYKECPKSLTKPHNNRGNNIYYCKPNCTEENPFEMIELQECVDKNVQLFWE